MKENEILDQKKLESINGEMFQSFDPDDASRVIGGKIPFSNQATLDDNYRTDFTLDIQAN
jgi:hypothetical protein